MTAKLYYRAYLGREKINKSKERGAGRRIYFMHWTTSYQAKILWSERSVQKNLALL